MAEGPAAMTGDGHTTWLCNGDLMNPGSGNWIGHVWPCIFLCFWATHWMVATFAQYLNSSRQNPYISQSWSKLFWFQFPIEPVIKVVFPFLAILLELWLAHEGGWRRLICPPGSVRAGHFQPNVLQNWQHAAMYPGFIISGAVELLGRKVDLPPGTQHVFLALAFIVEALLMGLHSKHLPLDAAIHLLLFYAMLSNAAAVILEVQFPRSFILTAARIGCMYLQGSWFACIANVMFAGHNIPWDNDTSDMAPVMYIPALFAMFSIYIIMGMATVFFIMTAVWWKMGWPLPDYSSTDSPALPTSEGGQGLKIKALNGGPVKGKEYRLLS